MAFLGAIIGAVLAAGSVIGSTVASIAASVGGFLAGVGETIASTIAHVTASVAGKIKDGLAALGGALTNLATNISKNVQDAIKIVDLVLSAVDRVLKPITDTIQSINDTLVAPIVNTIEQTYGSINSLITAIHTDIGGGIQGILRIPGDITQALTSVDAQFSRAIQQLGMANTDVVDHHLGPVLTESIGTHIQAIAGTIGKIEAGGLSPDEVFGQVKPGDCANPLGLDVEWGKAGDLIHKGGMIAEGIYWFVAAALKPILIQIEEMRNYLGCLQQTANTKNPIELLDFGDLVEAVYRGILTKADAEKESLKAGLTPERFQALIENRAWLPDVTRAIEMYYRGALGDAQLAEILAHRHLDETNAKAVLDSFLDPVNPREMAQFLERDFQGRAGWLRASLTSEPPSDIKDQYAKVFRRPEFAKWDWLAHWKPPNVEWWMTAMFRGLRTYSEFEAAARAENIPEEVIPDLVPVFQETVQLWMIPDILAANLMSDSEALAYLKYIGLGDKDAQIIFKWGQSKKAAPAAAQAADLASISAAQAKTMYTDGIIERAVYLEVLAEHGYSPDAAKLTVQLTDTENALTARKQTAQGYVDLVNTGQMTEQDALSALYSLGYTDAEVAGWALKIKQAKAASAKLPTESQFTAMLRAGVISGDEWKSAMQLLGFSPQWSDLLYLLEVKQNGEPPIPATVGGVPT